MAKGTARGRRGVARGFIAHVPARLRPALVFGAVLACASVAAAQSPDGAAGFQASCATCHTGARDSRAPSLEALRPRSPQSIIDTLLTGAMRPQGSRLSGAERRAVAEFITGKAISG